MRKSDRLAKQQEENLENETQIVPKVSKDQSNDRISKIAAIDNGTMVESFKYLNYCHLANNSLVSKRFRDLIQIHRHSLALLYIDHIYMKRLSFVSPTFINMFGKELSLEAFNEWVIRNNYSNQILFEGGEVYELKAEVDYKDPKPYQSDGITSVLYAIIKFNDENWPLFQHFVRLLNDPLIYIRSLEVTPQNDVLNLLAATINPDRNPLQCAELKLYLDGNAQNFIRWIKNHVLCDEFQIYGYRVTASEGELLQKVLVDFFLTGTRCTSKIDIKYYKPSKVIAGFVQKFMDLKNNDECQAVESIKCNVGNGSVNELKRKYVKFLVKEELDNLRTDHTFEFINNDIGRKLQLNAKIFDNTGAFHLFDIPESYFVLKIENL